MSMRLYGNDRLVAGSNSVVVDAATGTTVTGVATFSGGLDGAIGGTTPAAGAFTTGAFSGIVSVGASSGGTYNGTVRFAPSDQFPTVSFYSGTTPKAQIIADMNAGNILFDFLGSMTWRDTINGGTTLMTLSHVGAFSLVGQARFTATNTSIWQDSSSNIYHVIDRGTSARRAELVFVTAGDPVEAIPLTGLNWALGVADSDELAPGTAFCIAPSTNFATAPFILETTGALTLSSTLAVTGNFGCNGASPAAQPSGYTTFSNLSTDRTCDADTVAVAELADIVGTLIEDLKGTGLIAA